MSDRENMPLTNEHFAAWCQKMLGQPFWYGCCGQKATAELLQEKALQYPSEYRSDRLARCRLDILHQAVVCDCIGAAKGYAWTGGGQSIIDAIGTALPVVSHYGSHHCPDKSASAMFAYAVSLGPAWGPVATLPELPGLALFKPGHTGYYIGGGLAVEWRGFDTGCVLTKVAERDWLHWYALPFLQYA